MYTLVSGNNSNENAKSLIEKFPDKVAKIKSIMYQEKIAYMIFNETIDENLSNALSVALIISDNSVIPMRKNIADILYFALNVNNDKTIRIKLKITAKLVVYIHYMK